MLSFCLFAMATLCYPQQSRVVNNYTSAEGLPKLKIERAMNYTPDTSWLYNHHAYITHFKNSFIAIRSDGLKDEDQPGQRVLISMSVDFFHWFVPKPLATSGFYKKNTLNVLTAAGFHQFNDTLIAYFGEYSPHKTNTHL